MQFFSFSFFFSFFVWILWLFEVLYLMKVFAANISVAGVLTPMAMRLMELANVEHLPALAPPAANSNASVSKQLCKPLLRTPTSASSPQLAPAMIRILKTIHC
jgi:hypothetical protein